MKKSPEIYFSAGQKFVEDMIKSMPNVELLLQGDSIVSVNPPESFWGYLYHHYCIPPFKPESVLILGYGRGQIANLIRKVWGPDIKVTGVDLVPQDYKYMEYKMKICDAYEFVKRCTDGILKTRYDYIVIDLFDGEKVPEFVFHTEFVVRLKEMAKKLVCINIPQNDFDRLKPYSEYGFNFHRFVPIFGNNVSFWCA